MNYSKEQIDRANAVDLVEVLSGLGERFKKSGKEYRWLKHDSVTIYHNEWYRHSNGTGGDPIDFMMEFYDKDFREAVYMLIHEEPEGEEKGSDHYQDREKENVKSVLDEGCQKNSPIPTPEVELPARCETSDQVVKYLTAVRKIDPEVVQEFMERGDIYEEKERHHVVFVGRNADGEPGFGCWRSTGEEVVRGDVAGSHKEYGFKSLAAWVERDTDKIRRSSSLFVFESPIDLLSFITLYPKYWHEHHYLSLSGTSANALKVLLSERKDVEHIYLCLDNDRAGNDATARIFDALPEKYAVTQLTPAEKDWNEVLVKEIENPIISKVELRKTDEKGLQVDKMTDIKESIVDWLWYPFVPFSKVTLIQGDPGEGKTWLAMQLAAACTNRQELPNELPMDPFNVFYQTAEDGVGDTIKPRLMACGADMDRVKIINEDINPLSLTDPRLEIAIKKYNARLMILDPIQAYVGANVDMNRANEIRPLFRYLSGIAERTGCAIVLIGHLNKNSSSQSAYRGLGSIDISAAVRSILHVGKVKKEEKEEKDVRVVIQTKSSLAPKPVPVAYTLENGKVEWLGEYQITVEELMNGKGGKQEPSKLEKGIEFIREILTQRKIMYIADLEAEALKLYKISDRTMRCCRVKMKDELEYAYENGKKTVHLKTQ